MDESIEKRLIEIERRLKSAEHYMLWGSIVGTVRFLLIVIPLILAIIYIPPFVDEYFPMVKSIMQTIQQAGGIRR